MKAFLLAVLIAVGAAVLTRGGCHQRDSEIRERSEYGAIWAGTPESERHFNIANSKHASERGWQYLGKGDAAMAIKRFNPAWMIWPENCQVPWGMAIVLFERAKAKTSGE